MPGDPAIRFRADQFDSLSWFCTATKNGDTVAVGFGATESEAIADCKDHMRRLAAQPAERTAAEMRREVEG